MMEDKIKISMIRVLEQISRVYAGEEHILADKLYAVIAKHLPKDDFSVGYCCAVANMLRDHGDDVIARDCLGANYLTIKQMREIGVDESDIEILKPIVKEIKRRL